MGPARVVYVPEKGPGLMTMRLRTRYNTCKTKRFTVHPFSKSMIAGSPPCNKTVHVTSTESLGKAWGINTDNTLRRVRVRSERGRAADESKAKAAKYGRCGKKRAETDDQTGATIDPDELIEALDLAAVDVSELFSEFDIDLYPMSPSATVRKHDLQDGTSQKLKKLPRSAKKRPSKNQECDYKVDCIDEVQQLPTKQPTIPELFRQRRYTVDTVETTHVAMKAVTPTATVFRFKPIESVPPPSEPAPNTQLNNVLDCTESTEWIEEIASAWNHSKSRTRRVLHLGSQFYPRPPPAHLNVKTLGLAQALGLGERFFLLAN